MKRFYRLNRLRKAALITLTLATAGAITWLGAGLSLESKIARERAALVALGAPMTIEDIEALSLHEGKDAWPDLELAILEVERINLDPMEELLRKGAPWTPETRNAARAYVDAFRTAYGHLARASRCEVIRFKPGWFRAGVEAGKLVDRFDDAVIPGDMVTLVPEQVSALRLNMEIYAYAVCLIRLGRTDEAVEAYATIRRLAKLYRSTPCYESLHLWFSDQRYGDTVVLRLAREKPSDAAFLQKLVAATELYKPPQDARYYFLGEALHAEMALSDEEWMGEQQDYGPVLLRFSRFRRLLVLRQFRRWREVLEQVDDSSTLDEVLAASDRATQKIDGERGLVSEGLAYASPYLWLWNSAGQSTAARRNATMSVLNLMIERAKTGSFPPTLPDFRDCSVDPFTGGRLKMLVKEQRLWVYSVGENGTDDGAGRGDAGVVSVPLALASP